MCGGGGNEIKPTADQIAQEQVNAKLWNYYQTSYKPMISKYAQQVTSPDQQKAEQNKVAGQINAEVMKNINPKGVSSNPVVNAKTLDKIGQMEVTAQQTGLEQTKNKQAGDIQGVIDIGRGKATTASKELGSLAESSLREEMASKELNLQEQAATENMYGSLIGGAAAGIMYGKNKKKGLTPQDWLSSSDDYWSNNRP